MNKHILNNLFFSLFLILISTPGNSIIQRTELNPIQKSITQTLLADYIDLNDHPKGKGVNIKIKYPKDWQVLEGDRPNVLKKFVDDSNVFIILIRDNMTFFSRNEAKELFSDSDFSEEFINESSKLFTNPEILSQKIITIDNYPALEYIITGIMERSGYTMEITMKAWVILYEDKIVHLQASGLNPYNFRNRDQLYTSIINSIIFPDQYTY